MLEAMTILLILLRFLELLEFLASPPGIILGIWIGCYWLMVNTTAVGTEMASCVATLSAVYGYYFVDQPNC